MNPIQRPTRIHHHAALRCALCLIALLAPARTGLAQTRATVDPTAAPAPDIDPGADAGDGSTHGGNRRFTPLLAPVPFKNTQLGWGLMLMAGVIHRFDADTTIKPSTGAIGAFYTENGSWGVMALEMARLGHDRWRLRGLVSHMEVRYQFYGIGEDAGDAGRSVEVQQELNFAALSALGRVWRGLYVGPSALWMQSAVALRDSLGGLPPASADQAQTGLFAPGLQVEADTRNDDYWPTRGTLAKLKSSFFISGLGGERDFQRYIAFWSWYWRLKSERLVLGANINACAASGDAPYYTLCSVGAGLGGLRGYTQGRYRDTVMTTVQAEVRYHTAGRLGAVAFAGFGQVAPALGDIVGAEILPAGGLGLRYRLTRNYPMHMRVDYAWGRSGNLLYFSVAEAF